MPAHFMPTPPGVVGDTQRVARRGHPVVLSGEVLGIINMVYELAALAVDAPPPNRDAKLVPYGFLAWLTCPALVAVRDASSLRGCVVSRAASSRGHSGPFASSTVT
jgi:hypothetical protein